MEILQYMSTHWVEWLFIMISSVLSIICREIWKKLKIQQLKNDAIAEGVQSLLRESIVTNYNNYQELGYCPIYAKESIKNVYDSYHNLGGNDVATKLYSTILAMPEESKEKKGNK